MPFIGITPQALRLSTTLSASNSGSATTAGSAPFNNVIDTATIQNLPGMVGWYKDTNNEISVLAYAIAQASIAYGAALMHVAGGSSTATAVGSSANRSGFQCAVVLAATTGVGGYAAYFAGIAAASVINTGAGFWRYISGYVPEAQLASGIGSGHMLILGASAAGILASIGNLNAATISNTAQIAVGFSLGGSVGNAAGTTNSVYLKGWYM